MSHRLAVFNYFYGTIGKNTGKKLVEKLAL